MKCLEIWEKTKFYAACMRGIVKNIAVVRNVLAIKNIAAVLAVAALWAGCTCVDGAADNEEPPLRVTFLDVGQGLSVLLECNGRFALYDTGPDSVGVMDTLSARGVDTLEWVVVSHNHRDHAGGFMELGNPSAMRIAAAPGTALEKAFALGTVPRVGNATAIGTAPRVHVRRLYVGPDTAGGFIRDSVLRLAARFRIPVDTLVRGEALSFAGDAHASGAALSMGAAPRVDVLWPPDYMRVGENGASVVLRVEYGEGSVLLSGDLDSAGERRLLELSPTLEADLLQVGHHGSAGSSSLRFIAQVAPDFAVASVGAGNRFGHPAESVVRKYGYVLADSNRFYRTDVDGSVEFVLYRDLGVTFP